MTDLLAVCPEHGTFPAPGIMHLGPNTDVTLVGNKVTCPHCGRLADIVDGQYRTDRHGRVSARLRPTPAQLERLLTAARWAEHKVSEEPESAPVVVEKIRKTLKKESPDLFKWLDAFAGERATGAANFLTILLAVLTLFQLTPSGDIPQEQIEQVVTEVLQQRSDEQRTIQAPSTPTPPEAPTPSEAADQSQQPPE